ncbi:MAG: DoxX family membrane protein [Mucilaginibacter sp.]
MKIAVLIARVLLGLLFLVFGINFFYDFMHMQQPPMSPQATAFSGGLYGSGYFFPFLKGLEVICGLALIVNRFTALILVVLFPITINIFLFHVELAQSGAPMAIGILLVHLFLGYAYRKYYAGLFTATPTAD